MLTVSDLSFAYRIGTRVVDSVSLSLQPGERTAVLGPSGAGKTTLLRLLGGLLPVATGHIELEGREPGSGRSLRDWRQRVGMVFQDHALIPHRDVLWHVCTGALGGYHPLRSLGWWRQRDVARAHQLLGAVGLGDRWASRVQELSGGERQRVAVARALMQEPQVLIADEPIASLDAHTATEVLDLIGAVSGTDRACLVSLHQVDAALAWADRILVMVAGRLLLDQPAAALDRDDLINHLNGRKNHETAASCLTGAG